MPQGQPIDVQLPPVPDSIPRDTLRDICRTLGLDPANVREIRIGLREVDVTLYVTNSDGHKVRYGDDVATTVVTIPIH